MKLAAFASFLLVAAVTNVSAADAASGAGSAKAPEAETEAEAEVEVDTSPSKESAAASVPSAELSKFCFIAGAPPSDVKYTVVKKLKIGKGTYGSVKDILPNFAGSAQKSGADAVIDYTGSQRFGFWPWRMVRPVVRGTAVKWSSPPSLDCAAMGGSTLASILATDRPPAQ